MMMVYFNYAYRLCLYRSIPGAGMLTVPRTEIFLYCIDSIADLQSYGMVAYDNSRNTDR